MIRLNIQVVYVRKCNTGCLQIDDTIDMHITSINTYRDIDMYIERFTAVLIFRGPTKGLLKFSWLNVSIPVSVIYDF